MTGHGTGHDDQSLGQERTVVGKVLVVGGTGGARPDSYFAYVRRDDEWS